MATKKHGYDILLLLLSGILFLAQTDMSYESDT